MKIALLTAFMVFSLAAPAAAADVLVSQARAEARAEQAALAELISARLKAALQGETYSLDKTCDDTDCSISIHP